MEKKLNLDLRAKLYFYFRHGLFNHMFNTAKDGLMQFKGDNTFYLYEAISLIEMNRLDEGIHKLERLLTDNQLKLAATVALKCSHKLIGTSSKEFFNRLDNEIKEFCKSTDSFTFYYAAFSLMVFKEPEKALEYIEKALTLDPGLSEYYVLKGWILLEHEEFSNVQTIFQKSLQLSPNNLDAIIGLSECFFRQNNFVESLNVINRAVVQYNLSDLPLIQKLRIQFGVMEWDQAMETANRIISIDSRNLYARKLSITILLNFSANYNEALKELKHFKKILETVESKNAIFVLESSKLFSKVSNNDKYILNETCNMLANVIQNNSENVDVLVEMGNQYLMRKQYKDALRYSHEKKCVFVYVKN